MKQQSLFPACLTIAGSDSGGNAGVQADLRAFHAYSLHGCTVFAALTAQNPFGVSAIHSIPPEFVGAQLDAVLGVYNIKALKTGMLSDSKVIEVVAERLSSHPEIIKVIDPVMVATSGARLISEDAISALTKWLLPQATLITPNLPEAEELCGGEESQKVMAQKLGERFGCAVLVKGGHDEQSGDSLDILYHEGELTEFRLPRIIAPISTHGTGCTLAAALAAEFASGHSLKKAVEGAKRFVHRAIETSYLVGDNCGVLGFSRA